MTILYIFLAIGVIGLILYATLSRSSSPLMLYRMELFGSIYIGLLGLFILVQLPGQLIFLKQMAGLRQIFAIVAFSGGFFIIFLVVMMGFFALKEGFVDGFGTKTKTIKDKIVIYTGCFVTCNDRGIDEYVRTLSDEKEYKISHRFYLNQIKRYLDVKYFGEIPTKPRELPGLYCLKVLEHSAKIIQIEKCDN